MAITTFQSMYISALTWRNP